MKPPWALLDDPVEELKRIVLERFPDAAWEPLCASTLTRRLPNLVVHDGDLITWNEVAKVRDAIAAFDE